MKFKKLGTTDLDVSLICLGTMTWGTQNTEKDAFEQMDYSLSEGVNFFDTAELYSVQKLQVQDVVGLEVEEIILMKKQLEKQSMEV